MSSQRKPPVQHPFARALRRLEALPPFPMLPYDCML
jgi:hypothetical protein